MPPDELEEWLKAARAKLPNQPHEPLFRFEVAFAEGYERLLAGDATDRTSDLDAVIQRTRDHGRLVMAAEAGAGKSSIAVRVLARAIEQRVMAIRVDLRRWSPEVHGRWKARRESDTRRMAVLLELADVPIDERRLRRLSAASGALVAVDGLNEVPPSATKELLWVLDAFASRCPWAGVLVCDRLQRRQLSSAWHLATITDVERPNAEDSGGPDNALLLDIADQPADDTYNEAEILRGLLIKRARLDDPELAALEDTCLELYEPSGEGQGRFFKTRALRAGVGDAVADRLLESGELQEEGDGAFFRHHLFHDVLAAGAVAKPGSTDLMGGFCPARSEE